MRITSVAVAVAVALAVLSGCSDEDPSAAPGQGQPTKPKVSKLGPFFGECGSVTDDEVSRIVGEGKFPAVFRNSVGCVWESDGSGITPSATFSWYRGSPIGREKAGAGLIGRPAETIKVDGHPAFRGSESPKICEIGVQYDDDFFHWSVTSGIQDPSTDLCQVAMKLADLTASRVK